MSFVPHKWQKSYPLIARGIGFIGSGVKDGRRLLPRIEPVQGSFSVLLARAELPTELPVDIENSEASGISKELMRAHSTSEFV